MLLSAVTIRLIESTETHLFFCLNFVFDSFILLDSRRKICDGSKPNKARDGEKMGMEHDFIGSFHLCIENVGFIKNSHVHNVIILDLRAGMKKMNASSQQQLSSIF